MPYRHFLFSALAKNFNIDFYFFNEKPENIPSPCKYKILKGYNLPKFSDYWIVPNLRKLLLTEKYDLIIGSDLGAYITKISYLVSKETNTPFIPWIEEWDYINHPRRKLRRSFEDKLLSHCSRVIVPGSKHKNYLINRNVNQQKIIKIPNCLDESIKQLNQDSDLYSYLKNIKKNNKVIISSIGRHIEIKGHSQLIHAQKILESRNLSSSPFLVIAGNGPCFHKNKVLAEKLKIEKIAFINKFVSPSEKEIIFKFTDIFALTSTRKRGFEAWGFVCNEALMRGKPLIVSNIVGGSIDFIKHGENGYIFNDKNYQELANYIEKISSDDSLREEFSNKSQEIYNSFVPSIMIQKFIALFNEFKC